MTVGIYFACPQEKGGYFFGKTGLFNDPLCMYLEADFVCRPGTKVVIQMARPPAKSLPNVLSGEVRWYRQLFENESDYSYGLGVRLR